MRVRKFPPWLAFAPVEHVNLPNFLVLIPARHLSNDFLLVFVAPVAVEVQLDRHIFAGRICIRERVVHHVAVSIPVLRLPERSLHIQFWIDG